jgi:hypothetical protein
MAGLIAGPSTAGSNNAAAPTQRNIMINFKGSVSGLLNSTKSAAAGIGKLGAGVASIGKMFTSVLHGNIKPLINGVFSAVGKLASLFLIMPGFLLALVNPINVANMAMANFSTAISAASPAEFVAATRNMAPAMKDAVMSVRLLEPQLKNLYGIIQQGFWAGFSGDVTQLAQVYFPVLGQGLGGIATMLGDLREKLVQFLLQPQVVTAIQNWMTAFAGMGAQLLPIIENMLPAMITMFTAFANILISILPLLSTLVGWLANIMNFIAPILSGIGSIVSGTGAIGAVAGGTSSGGTTSSSGGGIGGFFSGIISGIGSFFSGLFGGGKAAGGPVMGGKSYLVGEHGPEILRMGGNGVVHPNSALGGHTYVQVKIGETELRGMINHEITNVTSNVAIAARMGRGSIV